MKASEQRVDDVGGQGAFSRALHSIRSRYSLSTAVFLLFLLALFYAGGRVVLVHLVRDAENQVKEIGSDLSRLVYKDAEMARRRMEASLSEMTSASARHAPRELLSPHGRPSDLSIAVSLSADGKPVDGACRDVNGDVREVTADFISEHPLNEGNGVLFRISDDGPGIPPEILRRIFDPYVSSKSLGRGLGLATVRTIVEAHGGGIRVQSRVDAGTTFQIFLPASTLPETEPARPEGAAEDGKRVVRLVGGGDTRNVQRASIRLLPRKAVHA